MDSKINDVVYDELELEGDVITPVEIGYLNFNSALIYINRQLIFLREKIDKISLKIEAMEKEQEDAPIDYMRSSQDVKEANEDIKNLENSKVVYNNLLKLWKQESLLLKKEFGKEIIVPVKVEPPKEIKPEKKIARKVKRKRSVVKVKEESQKNFNQIDWLKTGLQRSIFDRTM